MQQSVQRKIFQLVHDSKSSFMSNAPKLSWFNWVRDDSSELTWGQSAPLKVRRITNDI